jgi:hypothetical protein
VLTKQTLNNIDSLDSHRIESNTNNNTRNHTILQDTGTTANASLFPSTTTFSPLDQFRAPVVGSLCARIRASRPRDTADFAFWGHERLETDLTHVLRSSTSFQYDAVSLRSFFIRLIMFLPGVSEKYAFDRRPRDRALETLSYSLGTLILRWPGACHLP